MKNNRNNKLIAAGLATIAVAGLTIGTSGCLNNGTNGTAETRTGFAGTSSTSSNADDSNTDDHVTEIGASSVGRIDGVDPASGVVSGATSESAHSDETASDDSSTVVDTPIADETTAGENTAGENTADTAASDPEVVADAPTTETSTSDTPAVEVPSDYTVPSVGSGGVTTPTLEIELNPGATVEGSVFFGTDGDADVSLFLKESGFGGNDIVSVKLVYYVGDVKTTTGATLSREASTIRSIWRAENLQVSDGTMVSIRVTNSKGVITYTDVVVEITAPM